MTAERSAFERIQALRSQWESVRASRKLGQEIRKPKKIKEMKSAGFPLIREIVSTFEAIAEEDPQISTLPETHRDVFTTKFQYKDKYIVGIGLMWGTKLPPTDEDVFVINEYNKKRAELHSQNVKRSVRRRLVREIDEMGQTDVVIYDAEILAASVVFDFQSYKVTAKIVGSKSEERFSPEEVSKGALIPSMSEGLLHPIGVRLNISMNYFDSKNALGRVIDESLEGVFKRDLAGDILA